MLKTTLNALVLGHGPIRVIGLHGWFGNAQAWKPLADLLDSSRYTIAYLDYRGYGARIDVPGEWTMYEIAQDALQLANELGWDRFHLMGHSMGGMAIQRVMVEAPHRVGRLFAITPVPASGMPLAGTGVMANSRPTRCGASTITRWIAMPPIEWPIR